MEILIPNLREHYDHEFDVNIIDNTKSNFSLSDFDELKQTIGDIKNSSKIPFHLNGHDVHHYSLLYLLTMIFITFGIFMVFWVEVKKQHN